MEYKERKPSEFMYNSCLFKADRYKAAVWKSQNKEKLDIVDTNIHVLVVSLSPSMYTETKYLKAAF